MNKICRNCGAPVASGASFFCNRCGARLPAGEPDVLICRKCGKRQSDPLSRFCDRCGTPITPAVQSAPPARPAMQMKTCPHCGLENPGQGIFYCKKCGGSLDGAQGRPQAIPARNTGAPLPPRRRPVSRAVDAQDAAPGRRQEAPRKRVRLSRKMVIGIAAVILILIIAAFVFMGTGGTGTPFAGQNNSTSAGLLGAAFWNSLSGQTLLSNQGTAVFTDTPLTPKGT